MIILMTMMIPAIDSTVTIEDSDDDNSKGKKNDESIGDDEREIYGC